MTIIKSKVEKIREMKEIYYKLQQLGLNKNNEDIKKFQKIVNEYIRSDESYSGKIRINNTDRILEYILPKTNKHKCNVILKYSSS